MVVLIPPIWWGIGHDGCLLSVVLRGLQSTWLVSKPLWGLVWQNRCCYWVWWRYLQELAVDIDDLSVLRWGQLRNQHAPSTVEMKTIPNLLLYEIITRMDCLQHMVEIKLAIKKVNSSRAPGLDGIPAELLKTGSENRLQVMHNFFIKS